MSATSLEPLLKANINKAAKPALVQKMFQLFKKKPVFDCMSTAEKKITRRMASDDAGMRSDRVNFLNNDFGRFQGDFWISEFVNF